MKNYQLLEFVSKWKELKELSGGKGYYLPMVKNIKLIDVEIEALELIHEKTPKFNEFSKKKETLLIEYSKKDENNNPIKTKEIIGGTAFFSYDVEDKETYEIKIKELAEEYKEDLDKMMEKEFKYDEAMNADCTINFHKIKEKDMPDEMSAEQAMLIYDFIEFE